MSISDKVKILDVKGDGSCFYRSIYNSVKNTEIMNRIISFFNYMYNDIELVEKPSEEGFVKFTRLLISKLILTNNDYKIVKDVYNNLKSLSKDEYKEVITSFPDWFKFPYSSFQKISEDYFRIFVATNVKRTKNWVSQIEIEILQNLLAEIDLTLIIINNNIKRGFRFKKNEIYILNIGEYHYNSILPEDNNDIYYDKTIVVSPVEYRNLPSPNVLRVNKTCYSSVSPKKLKKQSKKSIKSTDCVKGKIINPETGRCVLETGKIGKAIIKDILKSNPKKQSKKKVSSLVSSPISPKKLKKQSKKSIKSTDCVKGKIINPETGRCVLETGKIGKAILLKSQPKKKSKKSIF